MLSITLVHYSICLFGKEAMSTLDRQHYNIRVTTPRHDTAEYRQRPCPCMGNELPAFVVSC